MQSSSIIFDGMGGVIRNTKNVKVLLDLFQNQQAAVSAVDLVGRLKDVMNKTTIYRILERLEDEGIIHSFVGKGGLKWYAKSKKCASDQHQDVHPHFHCSRCGKMECLDISVKIPLVDTHQIDSTEILMVGVCKDCLS